MDARGSRHYKNSMTTYPLCSETGCRGERIHPFGTCIRHLSGADQETYAQLLRRGDRALVMSSVDVDATFVHGWIDRISTQNDDGTKVVPVDVLVQDSTLVDGLRFEKVLFHRSVNLTGLKAHGVQIIGGSIAGQLTLDYAVLEDELSLQDGLRLSDLSLFGCEARHFGLLKSTVGGKLEARELKAKTGTIIRDVKIMGPAYFREAQLCDPGQSVNISAEFEELADFSKCKFLGETQLGGDGDVAPSEFKSEAKFDGAQFGSESFGALMMTEVLFEGFASFKNVESFGAVSFKQTKFQRAAEFSNLEVKNAPFNRGRDMRDHPLTSRYPPSQFSMLRTHFESSVSLGVNIEGAASIEDITYSGVAQNFSVCASDKVRLNRVSLESFNVLTLSSGKIVTIDQVQMHGGGELRVTSPELKLTNFTCARPVTASSSVSQTQAASSKLTTLAGTNCDALTLSGFDYGETKFLRATKLDSLIVSGEFTLRSTGGFWRAKRALLVEEAAARVSNCSPCSRDYWNRLATTSRISNDPPPELRHLAAVYRALRKGREDQKDEPGSADFYYGEMEMRRRSSPWSVERLILTLYWLVSGYGLRAWRAVIALALVIIVAATSLSRVPLRVHDPYPASFCSRLLFSAQSGLSLSGGANLYSPATQVVQLILRIVVPSLIALAVLAVRARVKR